MSSAATVQVCEPGACVTAVALKHGTHRGLVELDHLTDAGDVTFEPAGVPASSDRPQSRRDRYITSRAQPQAAPPVSGKEVNEQLGLALQQSGTHAISCCQVDGQLTGILALQVVDQAAQQVSHLPVSL